MTNYYDGNVRVGGPPQVRELPGLTVTKIAVGQFDNNVYLLRCNRSRQAVLVDAAAEPERLLGLVGDGGLNQVVVTHRHHDHWQALPPVVAATGAAVSAHRLDADGLPVPVDEPLEDGDEIQVGEARLRVIHLVGHTPGGVALLYQLSGDQADEVNAGPHLFTGDSLFPGGPGNTDGDPARFTSLMDDLERKIFAALPDSTWVYPGHGADTTLGKERPHLAEWRARGW